MPRPFPHPRRLRPIGCHINVRVDKVRRSVGQAEIQPARVGMRNQSIGPPIAVSVGIVWRNCAGAVGVVGIGPRAPDVLFGQVFAGEQRVAESVSDVGLPDSCLVVAAPQDAVAVVLAVPRPVCLPGFGKSVPIRPCSGRRRRPINCLLSRPCSSSARRERRAGRPRFSRSKATVAVGGTEDGDAAVHDAAPRRFFPAVALPVGAFSSQ